MLKLSQIQIQMINLCLISLNFKLKFKLILNNLYPYQKPIKILT